MNAPRVKTIWNLEGDRSINVVEACDPDDFALRVEEAQIALDADDGIESLEQEILELPYV